MSSEADKDLFDLENLFQPAWAQESASKRYETYEPREHADRSERRDRPRNRRGDAGRGPRREGPGGKRSGGGDRAGGRKGGPRRDRGNFRPERREPPPPLPELNVSVHAEDKGADSLARQIKTTGRAYPLFEIAAMILQKPDRFCGTFAVKKGPDGQPIQPLFVCALDDTLWLSVDELVAHVLRHHLATFYQADRIQKDPPKGTYTFVAQCGMSGTIFGPPNHHDYQNKLRELHARKFSRMPFEVYKSRVKIVRDEAVVKQWIEEQSWKTEYICLNVPEASRLSDMDAVEKHFREVHLPTMMRQVESHTLPGTACQRLRGDIYRAYRVVLDQQRRFPMQVATSLSQQFASRGLQFFKVNKTITHVWVARPTYLDLDSSPVSENVRRMVQFINEHPKCTRRDVIETLAPTPAAPAPAVTETPADKPVTAVEGESVAPAPQPAPAPSEPAPTPEQTALIADLHWLIHQGHVIEFANGTMETAKKPAPRPQKPEPKPEKPAAASQPEAPAPDAAASQSDAPSPDAAAPSPEPTSPVASENAAPPPSEEAAAAHSEPAPETTVEVETKPQAPTAPSEPAPETSTETEPKSEASAAPAPPPESPGTEPLKTETPKSAEQS